MLLWFFLLLTTPVIASHQSNQTIDINRCLRATCQPSPGCQRNDLNLLNLSFIICQISDSSVQSGNSTSSSELRSSLVLSLAANKAEKEHRHGAKWSLLASNCDDDFSSEKLCLSTAGYHQQVTCSSNESLCYSNNITKVFSPSFCYPLNQKCEKEVENNNEYILGTVKILYLVYGIVSLTGNIVVLFQKITTIRQKSSKQKEVQIYTILVLNLSMADFLMGAYVTILSINVISLDNQAMTTNHFIQPDFCDALGIMNFISSQTSVTSLVIISSFRLYGIVYPYSRVRTRNAYLLIVATWLFWITVGLIPVLKTSPIASFFYYGLRIKQGLYTDLHLNKPEVLFKNVSSGFCGNNTDCLALFESNLTPDVVENYLNQFDLKNESTEVVPLSYYNKQLLCSLNLMVEDPRFTPAYYTLSIIIYNMISFLLIVIFYLLMMKRMSKSKKRISTCLTCFPAKRKRPKKNPDEDDCKKRRLENEAMYRRVFIIIATDFICWMPICMISISLFIAGSSEPDQCSSISSIFCNKVDFYNHFQFLVFIVVPLNSVINPYIYSYNFWENLFLKAKKRIFK